MGETSSKEYLIIMLTLGIVFGIFLSAFHSSVNGFSIDGFECFSQNGESVLMSNCPEGLCSSELMFYCNYARAEIKQNMISSNKTELCETLKEL